MPGAPLTIDGMLASAPLPPVPRKTSPPIHSRAGGWVVVGCAALCAHALAITSASAEPARAADAKIIDKPIPFDDERVRLTLAYRRQHVDPEATDINIEPKVIVLHYTAGGTAEGTFEYFSGNHMEAGRAKLAAAGDVNVSSHFLVDRDGTIYRLMPETRMARHCIGLNHIAIGVENVGDEHKWPLTDAQVEADARLVRYLASRFPITHLVGHSEAARLEGKIYFQERDPKYRNVKPDPGSRFMKLVRARLTDLKLKGPP
ncbi:MAG: peptidoglycan recognition protein family protein [Solirubrobacteraceae bacterium]